jgi:hypothetical protein
MSKHLCSHVFILLDLVLSLLLILHIASLQPLASLVQVGLQAEFVHVTVEDLLEGGPFSSVASKLRGIRALEELGRSST